LASVASTNVRRVDPETAQRIKNFGENLIRQACPNIPPGQSAGAYIDSLVDTQAMPLLARLNKMAKASTGATA
jgi:hypothetical protein